ncbi:helix-turn-helix domain-containing protein [Vibrio sp. ArtGut-C1]|uniref:helix-turn-helix domain-containing protein n=1 Tax=Vibrio sp. ArtGut-C1 TaxID=2259137 RepID=UPI000A199F0D|nr:helix-turn-helix domain-containing protein [Vibrio sp. ArtGut-C1]
MSKIFAHREELVRLINLEIELASMSCEKNNTPDLSYLLPEVRSAVIDTLLLYTRGNQSLAARFLGINRSTLRKAYNRRIKG